MTELSEVEIIETIKPLVYLPTWVGRIAFYRSEFIMNRSMAMPGRNDLADFRWLVYRYRHSADPDDQICTTNYARLDQHSFVKSLTSIDEICNKSGSNDKAKYEMLRKATMEHLRLPKLSLSRP